jgi:hypothetical protein
MINKFSILLSRKKKKHEAVGKQLKEGGLLCIPSNFLIITMVFDRFCQWRLSSPFLSSSAGSKSYHKKYYKKLDESGKYKELTLVDIMKIYKKKIKKP